MSDEQKLDELRDEMDAQKLPDRVTRLPGQAQEAARTAAAQAGEQIETLADKVREHPLTAVAIAVGIGYLLGHLTT